MNPIRGSRNGSDASWSLSLFPAAAAAEGEMFLDISIFDFALTFTFSKGRTSCDATPESTLGKLGSDGIIDD